MGFENWLNGEEYQNCEKGLGRTQLGIYQQFIYWYLEGRFFSLARTFSFCLVHSFLQLFWKQ